MDTLDLRKDLRHLYTPSVQVVALVDVPELQFAVVDGRIEPGAEPGNSPSWARALEALYGISYTLKFMAKKRPVDPLDYAVMPLEGLWWVEDGQFDIQRKDNWYWTAMILQPAQVTGPLFEEALAQLSKKQPANPAVNLLALQRFREGLSVQIMHLGPYATEPATVEKMQAFAEANGYRMAGKHHEIYFGDPRRSAPEKLKTVLRHPVESVAAPTGPTG